MKVNKKVQRLFVEFLAQQGITIEFKMEIAPLYDSTDEYLYACYDLGMEGHQLLTKAFTWKDSKQLDEGTWEYHNKQWLNFLQEAVEHGKV